MVTIHYSGTFESTLTLSFAQADALIASADLKLNIVSYTAEAVYILNW